MQTGTDNTMQSSENGSQSRSNPMRITVWGTAACLLLLPLVAMQFTTEVNWTGSDFLIMGIMLLLACSTYEFGVWLSNGEIAYRAGFAVAVAASFLLVWVNLAVGIIGKEVENDIANLLFAGVILAWVIGGLIARFRPRGMSYAMIAATAVHVAIALFAAIAGWGYEAAVSGVLFCAMWLASTALFRKACEPVSDKTLRKLDVHAILSMLFIVNGAVMLTLMVMIESEPGLIPLLIVVFGVSWNLLTRYRIRKHGH
jgi:hypothetical protein